MLTLHVYFTIILKSGSIFNLFLLLKVYISEKIVIFALEYKIYISG